MKKLNSRGLNKRYVNVSKEGKEVYYSVTKNNMIIFNPIDEDCNTFSICNGIAPDAYDYLISALNKNNDLTVIWEQVSGTTSDYNIFYDTDSSKLIDKSYEEISDILNESVNGECLYVYKYTEVKNGEESIIKFNREDVKHNGIIPGGFIDHINTHKQDNRISNLRMI